MRMLPSLGIGLFVLIVKVSRERVPMKLLLPDIEQEIKFDGTKVMEVEYKLDVDDGL